jgi:hypothetical protein
MLASQLLDTPIKGNVAQARAMGSKIRLVAGIRAGTRDASCIACSKLKTVNAT